MNAKKIKYTNLDVLLSKLETNLERLRFVKEAAEQTEVEAFMEIDFGLLNLANETLTMVTAMSMYHLHNSDGAQTYAATGEALGVGYERIRQIAMEGRDKVTIHKTRRNRGE
jgi:hypothetical protein